MSRSTGKLKPTAEDDKHGNVKATHHISDPSHIATSKPSSPNTPFCTTNPYRSPVRKRREIQAQRHQCTEEEAKRKHQFHTIQFKGCRAVLVMRCYAVRSRHLHSLLPTTTTNMPSFLPDTSELLKSAANQHPRNMKSPSNYAL